MPSSLLLARSSLAEIIITSEGNPDLQVIIFIIIYENTAISFIFITVDPHITMVTVLGLHYSGWLLKNIVLNRKVSIYFQNFIDLGYLYNTVCILVM